VASISAPGFSVFCRLGRAGREDPGARIGFDSILPAGNLSIWLVFHAAGDYSSTI
jgi:predicted metal-binding membrane protein